jgi:hypothetical protein
MTSLLPPEFADLEPFAEDWCLPTEAERWEKRLASSMPEMQAFYDAAFPRLKDAMKHCDGFPLEEMPEPERRLMELLYSLIMVAMAVEVWHQPRVIDSGDAHLYRTATPVP